MINRCIMTLIQDSENSKTVIFDENGNRIAGSKKKLKTMYLKEGCVEQDPIEIWENQKSTIEEALRKAKLQKKELMALGITSQRDTTIIWDRETGNPVYNAITWECKRTVPICEALREDGMEGYIKRKTGLRLDPLFSATKIKWILDNVDGVREKAEEGELLFGTTETWIIWKLTGGKVHATDYTNASRTMLYDIKELKWDDKILDELQIPLKMLPEVKNSSEIYGYVDAGINDLNGVPIAGVIGDQQAGLFGQTCFDIGDAKLTYNSGCFLLMNTKENLVLSKHGLITTIAVGIDGEIEYALEGSRIGVGQFVQWVKDEIGLADSLEEMEKCASKVEDSNGVYIIPSFLGLGAPYWDMYAKGAILGLTYGVNKNHIIRAVFESIAYQSRDLIEAMEEDAGIDLDTVKVDGEDFVKSDVLMQILSDVIGIPVKRPKIIVPPELGVAYLAGLAVGIWKNRYHIRCSCQDFYNAFEPKIPIKKKEEIYAGWKRAINMLLKY